MRYEQVQIESIGYELPADVVTSADLEARLRPLYQALSMKPGQLEALTGVRERRWWQPGWKMCDGAIRAAFDLAPDDVPEDLPAGSFIAMNAQSGFLTAEAVKRTSDRVTSTFINLLRGLSDPDEVSG